ncbi:MAG: CDP-glucose 4,6-dehydratase [Rhodocyclales bacterium GWA2_65_19]|nr:MAG: CDP-glucose 4,6-dehydratase [Rhodocyclales bacterium GWA2_65_19]
MTASGHIKTPAIPLSRQAFGGVFRGKRVLVTGLTGFKGSWLGLWLHELGARVSGLSLKPDTSPSLFEQMKLGSITDSRIGDIRDQKTVQTVVASLRPEIVFHLAAQSLVPRSFKHPLETFETNLMGTAYLLEAARQCRSVDIVVAITTDKCYHNSGDTLPFRESDSLGGEDPYSASKACAEIAAACYRSSFFSQERPSLSTARAGNVIGGGDWAQDRILPDCVRALAKQLPVPVRNPGFTRPWQHVLEPLSGYLTLAAHQLEDPKAFAEAWNFGPGPRQSYAVREVVGRVTRLWGGGRWVQAHADLKVKEMPSLRLDSSKAHRRLGWVPVYRLDMVLSETVSWYKASSERGFSAQNLCLEQIRSYMKMASKRGLAWAPRAGA